MQQQTRPAFLSLGDSYTIGEAVPENARWPNQLVERLRASGIDIGDPMIIAKTGWTTDELSAAIDAARIDGRRFALVSLLIGVNNQYRGRPLEEYRSEFRGLLDRAIAFAGGEPRRVIVLSIPDWGVTPFAADHNRDAVTVAAEIDAFNRVNREITSAAGAHYVDVTPVSRRAAEERTFLAEDGLHPSGEMYHEWARLAAPIASAILRGSTGRIRQ